MTTASPLPASHSVLLVDDDVDVRHCLRVLFEFEDYEVTEATNGPEAIVLALSHEPHYILLDYLMPGMNGDKVAPVLRSLVPDARIVAFSATLDEKPDWADAFLNKARIGEVSEVFSVLLPVPRAV